MSVAWLPLSLTVLLAFIQTSSAISCYQCDSRYDPDCKEDFDWAHLDQLIIRPTECTVDSAQYCIKTTGVWGGVVGTTRFCSSRDMFNSCQYVTFPDHNRIYRACIYTCSGDSCNAATTLSRTTLSALLTSLVITLITAVLLH
jgi:hypothetical protein